MDLKATIIEVLTNAYSDIKSRLPQTTKSSVEVKISDINPWKLVEFMEDNNIPKDVDFCTDWDECLNGANPVLSYNIEVPMSEHRKRELLVSRFETAAFSRLYKILTTNGYKRVGFDTRNLKLFDKVTQMWEAKQYDRLVDYYSLHFSLK